MPKIDISSLLPPAPHLAAAASPETLSFSLPDDATHRLNMVNGPADDHLRMIERRTGAEIRNRGAQYQVIAPAEVAARVQRLFEALYAQSAAREGLAAPDIHLALLEQGFARPERDDSAPFADEVVIRAKRGVVRGRTPQQKLYLHNIAIHDVSFGIGPAGTGKTYLAVASAVEALERDQVRRIVLVRPAVEAGEKLGFLPGDLTQKVDPYLRPLYDALYEMLGFDRVAKLIERNVIEVAPLAYMRGRTLNDAFVIMDEAQNTTVEQMKMFLTRLGFGSKAVITGDVTQIDLPGNVRSGLKDALRILKEVEGISFTHFGHRDVVRHPMVQAIVIAYDAAEKRDAERRAVERAAVGLPPEEGRERPRRRLRHDERDGE